MLDGVSLSKRVDQRTNVGSSVHGAADALSVETKHDREGRNVLDQRVVRTLFPTYLLL